MSDGTTKHLSTINYEPLVVDVALDRLSMLRSASPAFMFKNGSLRGSIPAGQQLQFRDGLITAVTVPVLDATNTNPAYLRVTIAPEQIIQTALSAPVTGTMNAWQDLDFRLTMGNLETSLVSRIEPLT